jgi:hypothetical protein
MRFARLCLFYLAIFNAPAWSKQPLPPQQSQTTTPLPATKDSQAVSAVGQALTASGGITAIMAIADFTATGNVTYFSGPNPAAQGSITIRGKGLGQLRIDTSLPSGTRSESIDGLTILKYEDGSTQRLHTQSPLYPVRMILPFLQLAPTPTSSGFSLLNKGIVLIDSSPAYDIQVQRAIPIANDPNSLVGKFLTMDYFVDVATSHVVMMQDVVLKGLPRQISYADFRVANGLLVPFSITETIQGQTIRQFQLNQVNFNTGLQDSDFQL